MSFASSLISWFTEHAVAILFISVTGTVLGEMALTSLVGLRNDTADRNEAAGSVTSVAAGFAYIIAKGLVSKALMFSVAMWIYNRHRLFDLGATAPVVWLAMFVARDFVYYWIHRAEHRINGLWASHMIHHSSEEFTFTTAVRMPWMEALYKPALGLWAPLLGFHPVAFAAMGALVLVVGQFQHTELIRRRTVLDRVFVTPSAHRVHHGSNPEYIDKNFGSMLIVWDRLFGTYEPEEARVVFGLLGNKRVITIGDALVGGYRSLLETARTLEGWRPRLRYLVAAPS